MLKTNFKKSNINLFTIFNTQTGYSYIDSYKKKTEKILSEKRRRHQIYTLLDYLLQNITCFDFFSSDALKILIHAKYLSESCKKDVIETDFLLLSFFALDLDISKILNEYNLNQNEISNLISVANKFSPKNLEEKKNFYLNKIFNNKSFIQKSKYSHESHLFFEKVVENTIQRFKSPIITPEILFITLMEEKKIKSGKILQKIFNNQTEWYLLRYKLIKHLHNEELHIRNQVQKNEQYFAYLLKSELSENEFNRLIENESLSIAVSIFRNQIVNKVLSIDIFELLYKEINQSIKSVNKRNYSS
jgi:hypothetical protein